MAIKPYKLGPGDTLIAIAKREYSDGSLYQQIARYNRLPNPHIVKLGTEIFLPPRIELLNLNKFAPLSNATVNKGFPSQPSYTLIIGINPSATTKFGAINTGDNPGHTIVAFRDSSGKLVKVFSYGPKGLGLGAAIACSAPGRTGYHLVATDEYKLYEWPITNTQYVLAVSKIKEIDSNPGIFSANHQCTTTSLEVARAAGISVPSGTGSISVPLCGVTNGVSGPIFLDKELEKRFRLDQKPVKRVNGSHFIGFVEIQKN